MTNNSTSRNLLKVKPFFGFIRPSKYLFSTFWKNSRKSFVKKKFSQRFKEQIVKKQRNADIPKSFPKIFTKYLFQKMYRLDHLWIKESLALEHTILWNLIFYWGGHFSFFFAWLPHFRVLMTVYLYSEDPRYCMFLILTR